MSLEKSLAKLVSFNTVSGNHYEIERAFDWIRDEIQDLPLVVREYRFGGHHSLVILTRNTKSPKVWLAAHLDVVPGSEDQFKFTKRGKKWCGRGTSSMKYAIACYLELLKDIARHAPDYNLGIMLTSDEEVGGYDGTKALLNKRGYSGECALLPDEATSWHMEEWAKGLYGFKLIAEGHAVHGARPWKGKNAILMLCSFITELQQEFEAEFQPTQDNHWHSTLSVGMMYGGIAFNQVPRRAEAHMDMRYVSLDDRKVFAQMLKRLTKRYPGISVQKILDERDYGIRKDNQEAQRFISLARELAGKEVNWEQSDSSSDARFFAQKGIPTLRIGPTGGGVHSDAEWIDGDDLKQYYRVMRAWVKEVALEPRSKSKRPKK